MLLNTGTICWQKLDLAEDEKGGESLCQTQQKWSEAPGFHDHDCLKIVARLGTPDRMISHRIDFSICFCLLFLCFSLLVLEILILPCFIFSFSPVLLS